jgi:bifunctional DNA-binding transcriptional regulator/antitoxin component of YhaV-PrlF toxin-antitoxin module
MAPEFLAATTVREGTKESHRITIPKDVYRRLGEPEGLLWFHDDERGHIFPVPASEVTVE